MTTPIDLHPAADRLADLVRNVRDDQLGDPTPCSEYTVGDLLDHISGFPIAFRAAAVKHPIDGQPAGDASQLADDWRTRVPDDLAALAEAWDDPGAWQGMTAAGGVDLPGEIAGIVALDELVLHSWDLAVATGQDASYDGPGLDDVRAMVEQFRSAGAEGLFGPEVAVPDDAPLYDRILGLAGRDPGWSPS